MIAQFDSMPAAHEGGAVSDSPARFCSHCGAIGSARLEKCYVCKITVCEKCGNIQHSQGETHVVHDECLHKSDGSFSMIKIVE